MEFQFKYLEALEENNIQVKDLPEDARTGIKEINKAVSFIKMGENKGKKTSPDAIKKIKAMDKWVYYEILDYLHDSDKNEDEIPYESDDVEKDIEEQEQPEFKEPKEPKEIKGDANKINEELENLHKTGKDIYTIDEIKMSARNCYDAIYEAYEKGEENGVQTNNYALVEFEEQNYKLTKK